MAKTKNVIKPDIFSDLKYQVRVRNITSSGELYFTCQDVRGGSFRLWHKLDSGYELISEASSPADFDDLIPW